MPAYYKKFQALLYDIFINQEAHRVDETAEKMGISPSALYKYIEGELGFPYDLAPALYNATGEDAFLDFGVAGTSRVIAPRPGTVADAKTIEGEVLDVMRCLGEIADEVESAQKDGRFTTLERKRLEQRINEAQRELEELRNKLAERRTA